MHFNINWNLVAKGNVFVACSGGVDSMAVVSFLQHCHKNVVPVFFHHGTTNSESALQFLKKYFDLNKIPFLHGKIQREKDKSESPEEYWRNERYDFLKKFNSDIITAHHLDDAVETYLWSMMHGQARLPLWRRDFVVRPFLLNKKECFINWCKEHDVPWIEDNSNVDTKYTRNLIRKEIVPLAKKVNPGIDTVVKKMLIDRKG
jgi:tRNA(Ile)-lysidine synthase